MNWDAIGAIAELLGAIGVIASLVYLATQIRHSRDQMSQNTRALRATAYQDVLNQRDALMLPLIQSGETADLMTRGLMGLLSDGERVRFNVWFVTVMSNLENIQYQHRVGLLDEDRWRTHFARLRTFVTSPVFAEWWSTGEFGFSFSPEFVALVEEILGEEAEGVEGPQ
jgi:hypothetical protein